MDNPQYLTDNSIIETITDVRFKPYYKWITLNTTTTGFG